MGMVRRTAPGKLWGREILVLVSANEEGVNADWGIGEGKDYVINSRVVCS